MLDLPEPDRATFADLGRTTIRIWEWGDPSDPPVLMVHGGWDHGRMWDGLAPRVAALGRHAVAIDVRGHGDSGRLPEAGPAWPMFLLDLAQVVQRLGPPPEMMQVQDHAASAARWLFDAERIAREPQREYASVEEMAKKRKEINTRLPYEWCLHLAAHGTRPGPNGGVIWKSDPHMRLGSPGPFSDEQLIAQYATIRAPVMALSGTEADQWSFLQPDDRARRLAAFDSAEHHPVAGAGHYVHVEQPEETTRLLDAFINR